MWRDIHSSIVPSIVIVIFFLDYVSHKIIVCFLPFIVTFMKLLCWLLFIRYVSKLNLSCLFFHVVIYRQVLGIQGHWGHLT